MYHVLSSSGTPGQDPGTEYISYLQSLSFDISSLDLVSLSEAVTLLELVRSGSSTRTEAFEGMEDGPFFWIRVLCGESHDLPGIQYLDLYLEDSLGSLSLARSEVDAWWPAVSLSASLAKETLESSFQANLTTGETSSLRISFSLMTSHPSWTVIIPS